MNQKRIILASLGALLAFSAAAMAAGGDDSDPLITKSYLYNNLCSKLQTDYTHDITQTFQNLQNDLLERLDLIVFDETSEFPERLSFQNCSLNEGATIRLAPYTTLQLTSGNGKLTVLSGEVLNLSEGTVLQNGAMLRSGNCCFSAEETFAEVMIYSETAEIMIKGSYLIDETTQVPVKDKYLDVPADSWYAPYVWKLTELGLVSGTDQNRFDPMVKVTRSAFVTILGRLYGASDEPPTEARFSDVPVQEWFAPYVEWAAEQGVVTGYTNGSFQPNQTISREQMATMLYRFVQKCGYEMSGADYEDFVDEPQIADYAKEAVQEIRAAGIINGVGENRFAPKGTATRAEACTAICRLLENTKKKE